MLKLFELSVADRNLAILLPKVIADDIILLFIAIDFLLNLSVDRLPIKLISYRTRKDPT